MYPRRMTRVLFDGRAIVTNSLPNRDYTHGRYHMDVVPGIQAEVVRLPFLASLAVDRMAKLGVDTSEIRARMLAADEARMRLFDADDHAAERRERAEARASRKPAPKRRRA